jgi:hypothetical protein
MPRTYLPEPSPVARGRAAHLLSVLGPGIATNTTLPNRPSCLVTGVSAHEIRSGRRSGQPCNFDSGFEPAGDHA